MKKHLLILFLLPALLAKTQTPVSDRIPAKYLLFSVEPLAALDDNNGESIRIGAEYRFHPDWSFAVAGGAYLQRGYMLRAELKSLFTEGNEVHYFSLEYEYLNHVFTLMDSYRTFDSATGEPIEELSRPMNYNMDKHIYQVNLKFGSEHFWRHHWYFEGYGGIGIKFKTASRDISDDELDKLYHFHESVIRYFSSQTGSRITFALCLGIRFGRVFKIK